MKYKISKIFIFITMLISIFALSSFGVNAKENISEQNNENCIVVDFGNDATLLTCEDYEVYSPSDYLKNDTIIYNKEYTYTYDDSSFEQSDEKLKKFISEYEFWYSNKQNYQKIDKEKYIEYRSAGDDVLVALEKATTTDVKAQNDEIFQTMKENKDFYEKEVEGFIDYAESDEGKNFFQKVGDFIAEIINGIF